MKIPPALPNYLKSILSIGLFAHAGLSAQAQTDEPYEWKQVVIGGGGYCTGVTFSPSQPGVVIARSDVAGPWIRSADNQPWKPLTWGDVSPLPLQGSNGSAIHPTNGSIIFVELGRGSPDPNKWGGLYRSSDGGTSWDLVVNKYSNSAASTPVDERAARKWGPTIAIDPNNPSVVYWGSMKNGIFRTLNGGATPADWSVVRTPEAGVDLTPGTRSVVIDPRTLVNGRSKDIYASVNGKGVFRSTNGGDSFELIGGPFKPTRMCYASDGVLYVAHLLGISRYSSGIWTDITPPNRVKDEFSAIDVDPANPARIVAFSSKGAVGISDTTNLLFRSGDRGTTWEDIPRSRLVTSGTVPSAFELPYQSASSLDLNPAVPGEAYMSDSYMIWKTTNIWASGDIVWTAEYNNLENVIGLSVCTPPLKAGVSNIPRFFTGVSDLGGFRHVDPAVFPTQIQRNDNFYNTGYDYCEDKPNVVWLFAQSSIASGAKLGLVYRSLDGGQSWGTGRNPAGRDGNNNLIRIVSSAIAASATDENRAVFLGGNAQLPRYTTDGGLTWNPWLDTNGDPLPTFSRVNEVYYVDQHVAGDRVNGMKFYAYQVSEVPAGQSAFWYSWNGGVNWQRSSTVITTRGGSNTSVAPIALVAAPGREGDVWLSRNSLGLWRSTDGGVTLSQVAYFKGSNPLSVAFGKEKPGNPANQPTVYVWGIAASDSTNTHALYRSTDMGANWTRLTGLTGLQFSVTLGADRQEYGRIYLATGSRAFLTGVPSQSWTRTADWTPAVNPDGDLYGNAGVWTYYTAPNVADWYEQSGFMMVWNSIGYWRQHNDASGISRIGSSYLYQYGTASRIPIVQFTNPGSARSFRLSGTLALNWNINTPANATATVAITRVTAGGDVTLVQSRSASRTTTSLVIDSGLVALQSGESLTYSIRAVGLSSSTNLTTTDSGLTLKAQ